MITAFSGYTAVYALNDIVDYRVDCRMNKEGNMAGHADDLDAVFVRHPLAQGMLSYRAGLIWAGFWGLVALVGAYLLNPLCSAIFIMGCILEALYCKLLQVSYWRTIISGVVKTLGGIAAVLAVDPHPSIAFLVALFVWIFAWEIGGQNIPNDWTDQEEDDQVKAITIPVEFGARTAGMIIVFSLTITAFMNFILYRMSPVNVDFFMVIATVIAIVYLIYWPAYRLHINKTRQQAAFLFNRASYYPLAILIIVLINFMV